MSYHFEATSEFFNSCLEIDTLIELADHNDENRSLFLKLSVVSIVTKFQVFVESVLEEYIFFIKNGNIQSGTLSTHIKMNSLRMSLENGNPLMGLLNHKNFSNEKLDNIVQYLNSLQYLINDDVDINDDFYFKTKYPLGKTGKNELIDLLWQIDGNQEPFDDAIDLNKLDSLLLKRHLIIHQDRFSGTDVSVKEDLLFCKNLVLYIDTYLNDRII